jgi:hypothetical protein
MNSSDRRWLAIRVTHVRDPVRLSLADAPPGNSSKFRCWFTQSHGRIRLVECEEIEYLCKIHLGLDILISLSKPG